MAHHSYQSKSSLCYFQPLRCCVFAMAFPFQYGLDFLLPTPLKQFLALGRFAWPFYFIITVFSLKALKNMLSPRWFMQFAHYFQLDYCYPKDFRITFFIKEKITQYHNILNDKEYHEIIRPERLFSNYQAIITSPVLSSLYFTAFIRVFGSC